MKNETIDVVQIEEKIIKTTEIALDFKSVEAQKVDEVVAQIIALKKQNNTVSYDEIDALLNQAQKEIQQNKIYTKNSQTIDATALLQDVEDDLNRSFRKKVFDALKINYTNVKTAVAQRNN